MVIRCGSLELLVLPFTINVIQALAIVPPDCSGVPDMVCLMLARID
jgi:hypothetical protein